MIDKKTQISIWATPKEVAKIELIKQYHERSNYSDTLRMLINQEEKKILGLNVAIATEGQAAND